MNYLLYIHPPPRRALVPGLQKYEEETKRKNRNVKRYAATRWGTGLIKTVSGKGKLPGRGYHRKVTAHDRTFYPILMCNALPSIKIHGQFDRDLIENHLHVLCFPYTFKPASELNRSSDSDDTTTRLADPIGSSRDQIGKLVLALLKRVVQMCSESVKDGVSMNTPLVITEGYASTFQCLKQYASIPGMCCLGA